MSKKILEMIENVSPDDTDTLDEIDDAVNDYINSEMEGLLDINGNPTTWEELKQSMKKYKQDYYIPYTRSRDALKVIRPKGWWFDVDGYFKIVTAMKNTKASKEGEPLELKSPYTLTEELAELHAIIQAIEWERKNDI